MRKFPQFVVPLLLAVLLAGPLAGCSNLGYYVQAMGGHFEVMRAAQPISELVRDPAGDPQLRKKLEEVQVIREFASRELGLPDNNSYRSYADVGHPYVVWNVFAAPEFSLEPKRWCMLLVGCVNYRKQLQSLYKTADAVDRLRQAKAGLQAALRRDYADLKASWGGYSGYDNFFAEDLNNAKLVSLSLYSALVPAFETLLEQEKRDLPRFYQRVRSLAALDKEARRGVLAQLLPLRADTRLARSGVAPGTPEMQ